MEPKCISYHDRLMYSVEPEGDVIVPFCVCGMFELHFPVKHRVRDTRLTDKLL
jgi:hypothetical protein